MDPDIKCRGGRGSVLPVGLARSSVLAKAGNRRSERNRTKPDGYRPSLSPNVCPFLSTGSTKSIPAGASRTFENQKTFQQATLSNFSQFQPLYPKEREVRLFIPHHAPIAAVRVPNPALVQTPCGTFIRSFSYLQYVKEHLAPYPAHKPRHSISGAGCQKSYEYTSGTVFMGHVPLKLRGFFLLTTLPPQQPAQPGICARAITGTNGEEAIMAPACRARHFSRSLVFCDNL